MDYKHNTRDKNKLHNLHRQEKAEFYFFFAGQTQDNISVSCCDIIFKFTVSL